MGYEEIVLLFNSCYWDKELKLDVKWFEGVKVGWSSLNFDLEGRDREMLEGL